MAIWIDIETRARLDVTKVGLYAHAPTVEKILCIRYAFDDGPILEWRGVFADGEHADSSDAPPRDLITRIQAGDRLYAHNAAYERVVMRDSPAAPWWPDVPIEQWVCTASWASAFNLPRGLGPLSKYLLEPEQAKLVDVASGVKYMWHADQPLISAEDMDKQSDYCEGDVVAMRAVMQHLPPVDPDWLAEYHAAEHINDRGVMVDTKLARAIVAMKPRIDADLAEALDKATGGGVKTRGPSLGKWLKTVLPEDAQAAMTINEKVRKDYGFRTKQRESANKVAREQILEAIEERTDLGHVREALEIYEEANRAAVSKFAAAALRVSDDDILRGQFIFSGAGQTGRFSSNGVQVHNLKREVSPDAVEVIAAIKEYYQHPGVLTDRYGMSLNLLCSTILRPVFVAPEGTMLVWGDWSSIEARGLPWLSGDPRAEDVLDVFRIGKCVYMREATNIFHDPVTDKKDPRRQIGKVAVLSLGYQGAVGAFQAMAAGYNVTLSDAEVRGIVDAWREANGWAVDFWAKLEQAAMNAVTTGRDHKAGRVLFQFVPELLGGTLIMWLPGGGWCAYPGAEVKRIQREEGGLWKTALTFMHPTYGPSATYGGALAENATQAFCARLLRDAIRRANDAGLEIVLHVHDELVCECDEDQVEETKAKILAIMNEVVPWAEGLPLAAEVEAGIRYKVPHE